MLLSLGGIVAVVMNAVVGWQVMVLTEETGAAAD